MNYRFYDRFSSANLREDDAWRDIRRADADGTVISKETAQYISDRYHVKTLRGVANALGRLAYARQTAMSPAQETRWHLLRALQSYLNV